MLSHHEKYICRFNMYKTYAQTYFLGKKKVTHAYLACMITFRKSMIGKKRMTEKARSPQLEKA